MPATVRRIRCDADFRLEQGQRTPHRPACAACRNGVFGRPWRVWRNELSWLVPLTKNPAVLNVIGRPQLFVDLDAASSLATAPANVRPWPAPPWACAQWAELSYARVIYHNRTCSISITR
ncbi:hypothetical protein [Reyranella sp.]|uniref:hypothetical protein n=1 Tax=Reyranella sp. TaxID=1929291 RepID=UPI002730BE47|nr:hypothetical protein [Reyranella sp.]MDP2374386.1 hypothetical protein [Reyranella sp.]